MPMLPTRVWNFTAALIAFVSRPGFVGRDEYQDRLEICADCEKRAGNSCRLCGCGLTLKARAAAWHCPLGLWPGDVGPPELTIGSPVQPSPILQQLADKKPLGERAMTDQPDTRGATSANFPRALRAAARHLRKRFQESKSRVAKRVIAIQLKSLRSAIRELSKG